MSDAEEDLFPDDTSSSENSSTSNVEVPYFLQTPVRKNITQSQFSETLSKVTNSDNIECSPRLPLKIDSKCNVIDWIASVPSPQENHYYYIDKGNIETVNDENVENNNQQNKSMKSLAVSDLFSSDDDEEDELFNPSSKEDYEKLLKKFQNNPEFKFGFIHSLLDCVENRYRDPEAHRFRINYKYWKEELARRIFNIFNQTVFLNMLPSDTKIVFNPRLLTTAGICKYQSKECIEIHISPKVCSDANRLLSTMIHEMCHGATFLINKCNDHHGPLWKAWCMGAKKAFPLVALSSRCHTYNIKTKYQYRCESCPYIKAKHSKYKKKQICKRCRGNLVLFSDGGYGIHLKADENKPLTGFAAFVKDHYKETRCDRKTHKEAMKILSEKFYMEKLQCETDLRNRLLKDSNL